MKLNVIVNGKTGTINLTHSTFIVEDLKAHICKKMDISTDDYKLKIDFENDTLELVQTKANPSFSSGQRKKSKDVYGVDSVPHFILEEKSHEEFLRLKKYLSSLGNSFIFNATNNPTNTTVYTIKEALNRLEKITDRLFIFDLNEELIGIVRCRVHEGRQSPSGGF